MGTCSGALTAGLVLTEPRGRRARASFLAATATTAAVGFGRSGPGRWPSTPRPAGAQLPGGDRAAGPGGGRGGPAARLAGADRAAMAAPVAGPPGAGPRRVPGSGRGEPAGLGRRVCGAGPGSLVCGGGAGRRLNLFVDGTTAGSLLLVAALAQAVCRSWDPARAQVAGLGGLTGGLLGLIAAGLLTAGSAGSAVVLFAAMAVAGCGQMLAFMGGPCGGSTRSPRLRPGPGPSPCSMW